MQTNFLTRTTGADFSTCLKYRYKLWRHWADGPVVNFIMLNPSTADDVTNDPTVERCERRAADWGFGGLVATNLFALRATDPSELRKHPHPIGEARRKNDFVIAQEASTAGMIVCAWGGHGKLMQRSKEVREWLAFNDVTRKLHALRVGKNGEPCHPLYLPYSLKPFKL